MKPASVTPTAMPQNVPLARSRWMRALQWTAILLVLFFVGRHLWGFWPALRDAPPKCRLDYLAASVVVYVTHMFCSALLWHGITISNGCSIRRREALVAWFYSVLGKYVPGKVVLWAGRVYYYKRRGHSVARVTLCFMLEMMYQMLAASIIVAMAVGWSDDSPLGDYRFAAWALGAALAVVVYPPVLQTLVHLGCRLTRREEAGVSMRPAHALMLLVGFVVNGLQLGLAFHLLMRSLYPVGAEWFVYLSATILAAGIIGVLSLFAPSGIGVREGILLIALKPVMPGPIGAAAVIVSRLWTTAAELVGAGAAVIVDRATGGSEVVMPPQDDV